MYSLDFEEFLWANEIAERSVADVRAYFDKREKVLTAIHEKMMELFMKYIIVGGMPRVVWEFVNTHNFANVLRLQKAIVNDYEDDNFCYNLALPELPLEGNARSDIFKVYMRDTGLLMSMLEDGSQEDIILLYMAMFL